MKNRFLLLVIATTLLISCATDISSRLNSADYLANGAGLTKSLLATDSFTITSYSRVTKPGDPINIYIEGDGFAWVSRDRISSNPTPRSADAIALNLAALDNSANVSYLARPCQYTDITLNNIKCESKFWSGSRFSNLVIDSMNQAVDAIAKKSRSSKINLIGYSGGAAVALLIASRRNDIASIRTIAGNLDHVSINRHHHVSQMMDSLNPADYASELSNIPQYHFSGANDKIVPPFIVDSFIKKLDSKEECVRQLTVKNTTHHQGWSENWAKLLAMKIECKKSAI